jgi:tRNA-specific 2-thiouridylase
VLCNREVKFAAFLKAALDLGADFVATGHYCRKEKFKDDSGNIIYRILRGRDPGKDQSYFLCQLDQQQLSRALFPIGHLLKSEVRELAREAQLPSAEKKDSQGICFVGKVDLPLFLQQKLEPKEGDVVEIFREHYDSMPVKESLEEMASPLCYTPSQGKVIGSHQGAYYYTIGQRKGLNIGGHKEPLFIISIDIITNTIYVGEGESHPGLYRRALKILPAEVHWIRPDLALESSKELKCDIRIRYRQPLQKGRLICRREALYILFDKPQRGITPGQFAVWYAPDGEMLGSGVING